jgi:hypothetical protein
MTHLPHATRPSSAGQSAAGRPADSRTRARLAAALALAVAATVGTAVRPAAAQTATAAPAAAALTGAERWADSARVAIEAAHAHGDRAALGAVRALLGRALVVTPNDALLQHYLGYAQYREGVLAMTSGDARAARTLLEGADTLLARSASAGRSPRPTRCTRRCSGCSSRPAIPCRAWCSARARAPRWTAPSASDRATRAWRSCAASRRSTRPPCGGAAWTRPAPILSGRSRSRRRTGSRRHSPPGGRPKRTRGSAGCGSAAGTPPAPAPPTPGR